ncbi:hypothetical protein BZG36_01743 [Bifiguratus adelaidae]|uniref:Uncharacterized protein n=1 Tax=Bifiguratus adelaidae TaxID=1938954 RepID=A0A261Y304_9FUNG|nr:hypothetical protein BZG36_01743 [Bifiguratus adelaidae]
MEPHTGREPYILKSTGRDLTQLFEQYRAQDMPGSQYIIDWDHEDEGFLATLSPEERNELRPTWKDTDGADKA